MVKTENFDFLGTIHSSDVSVVETNKWTKTLNQDVLFKIDTGANVTVIPEIFYKIQQDGPLQPTQCLLTGAGQQPLEVQGQFVGHLRYNSLETEQTIFVIQGLSRPLLGHPAIEALSIVSEVEPIMSFDCVTEKFL